MVYSINKGNRPPLTPQWGRHSAAHPSPPRGGVSGGLPFPKRRGERRTPTSLYIYIKMCIKGSWRGGVSGGHRFGASTHCFGASTNRFGDSTHRFGAFAYRFGVSTSLVGISSNQGSVCTNQGSVCTNADSVYTNTALVYRLQPFFPHSIYGQRQLSNGSPSSSERLGPKGTWFV